MEFPDRLTARVEMAFGALPGTNRATWLWTDVTADLPPQTIQIARGRQDEMAQVQPSITSLYLDNTSGNYTPGKAESVYYPNVVLGTPMRIWVDLPPEFDIPGVIDEFQRNVTTGWANADTGQRWITDRPASYSVGGLTAKIAQTGTETGRKAQYIPEVYGDVDVTVSLQASQVSATGRVVIAALAYRWADRDHAYFVEAFFAANGTVTLGLAHGPTVIQAPVATGLTYAAATPFWVRARAIGNRQQVKIWATGAEPAAWLIDVSSAAVPNASPLGGIGLAISGDPTGAPAVRFDHLSARHIEPRWTGYVSEWAPHWPYGDLSGPGPTDLGAARVTVAGAGILRRLGQGAAPVQSALRREMLNNPARRPLGYWPGEDAAGATTLASATGGRPMTYSAGTALGAFNEIVSTAPLPVLHNSSLRADLTEAEFPATGQCRFVALAHVPKAGVGAGAARSFWVLHTTGTTFNWFVDITAAGGLQLVVTDKTDAVIFDSGEIAFNLNGKSMIVSLWLQQQGPDIAWQLSGFEASQTVPGVFSGVLKANTFIRASFVVLGFLNQVNDVAIGHVALFNVPGFYDATIIAALRGWDGETAGKRVQRLAADEQIPIAVVGDPATTRPMGPQAAGTLLQLLRECADADGGVLYESRSTGGLEFRTRVSMLDQTSVLTLDADNGPGDIVNPFTPILDDQGARNDMTVSRRGGSSARVTDAADIARRGRYDEQITLNVSRDDQLPDIAAWLVKLGTWPGMRYPTVSPALNTNADLLARWRLLDLGDRISILGLPPQHPSGTVDLLAQGYVETIQPHRWDAVINGSPAGPWVSTTLTSAATTADLPDTPASDDDSDIRPADPNAPRRAGPPVQQTRGAAGDS
ncbi:hypothetical protein [Amycolatopsis sp. NPDC051716]|uniref:hypothetical protein n=1 Tax=Amycolatopsis sp. NPDC051716 TaxID=3155804 RepID=UPI00341A08D2